MRLPSAWQTVPRDAIHAPSSRRHTPASAGACKVQQAISSRPNASTCVISRVVSRGSATRVTQLSSLSLRARARRTNDETYVAENQKDVQARHSDTTLELSAPLRAYALAVPLNESHVTPVAGGRP